MKKNMYDGIQIVVCFFSENNVTSYMDKSLNTWLTNTHRETNLLCRKKHWKVGKGLKISKLLWRHLCTSQKYVWHHSHCCQSSDASFEESSAAVTGRDAVVLAAGLVAAHAAQDVALLLHLPAKYPEMRSWSFKEFRFYSLQEKLLSQCFSTGVPKIFFGRHVIKSL